MSVTITDTAIEVDTEASTAGCYGARCLCRGRREPQAFWRFGYPLIASAAAASAVMFLNIRHLVKDVRGDGYGNCDCRNKKRQKAPAVILNGSGGSDKSRRLVDLRK